MFDKEILDGRMAPRTAAMGGWNSLVEWEHNNKTKFDTEREEPGLDRVLASHAGS